MLTAHHAARTARRAPSARSVLARLHEALAGALALSRSRAALSDLDDHILRDIGLTRDEARAEARRPIWDAPESWFR